MAFTIPNEADAAFSDQAEPDSVDLSILAAAAQRTGVVLGCAVTAQGSPDMTLAVGAGIAMISGALVVVSAGNVTITTANGSNPRFDLVVVNNAGVKSVTAGTAAGNPVFPVVPANSAVLAAVYVPATDTAINSNQITDKRVTVSPHGAVLGTRTSDLQVVNTTTETVAFTVTIPGGLLAAGDMVRIWLAGDVLNNSGAGVNYSHNVAVGATVLTSTVQSVGTNSNRAKFSGAIELIAVSTSAQRLGMIIMHTANGTTTAFQPHSFVYGGYGATAEDTSTSKALEWRVKMGTANAAAEIVAKYAVAQLFKATG